MSDELPESPESVADAQRQTVVLLAILVEGGLLAGASLLGWMTKQPPLLHFAWTWQAVLWGVIATIPLVIFFILFLCWPIGPLRRIQRFSEQVIRPLLAPCSLLDLFGISLLAGLGEEMLFRGVLQEAFTTWFNVWVGVIVASVLFGVLHSITFTYALLAALMGVYLGCVFRFADHNLLAVILTHALYDFVVLLWLMRGPGAAEALAAREAAEATESSPEPPSQ
ncbi:MAG TPA: CPBP family intramembrane glutamic endopeptidase [Gemmataceae bacterium]|nr:CPBP family intramembrane glutamic endopeptidase [Gemmataceae bacterium]